MATSNQTATPHILKQPTDWGEKRSDFCAHPLWARLWARLWAALAFALLLATITIVPAGAASLDRPVDAAQRQAPPVGEPYLVKDVNATTAKYLNPENLLDIDGVLYFSGGTSPNSSGLWRSNGTAEGTILLKRHSSSYWNVEVAEANGIIFFTIESELWKTNGTLEGTALVKALPKTTKTLKPLRQLVNVNGTLYFQFGSSQLWKSDGTSDGTLLVKEADPDDPEKWLGGFNTYLPIGDTLFFAADTSVPGVELWKSDGTAESTVLVKAFERDAREYFSIRDLININDSLYFFVGSQDIGYELWISDGTSEGTRLLRSDISRSWGDPLRYMNLDDTLIFQSGRLWRSDGTVEGTYPLVNPESDETYSISSHYAPPVLVGDHIYFRARTKSAGDELWKSDGTPAGTVLVKDINLGNEGSSISSLTEFNDQLYFFTNFAGKHGLWTSDGTVDGTLPVNELMPAPKPNRSSYFSQLINLNGAFYFIRAGETGYALWKSDGTPEGTAPVREVHPFDYDGMARNLSTFGDKLAFGTYERNYDDFKNGHLWVSDGTADGTSIIAVGSGDSKPSQFVNVNGTIYFAADDGIHGGEQLWKTDGTEAGTSLVAAVNELPIAPLYGFQNISDTLFLRVPNNGSFNLWSSDGTEAGTEPFLDPPEDDPYSVWPTDLWRVRDSYLFFNGSYSNPSSLWKTDGTKAGTSLVTNVGSNSAVTNGERLFFVHADGTNGKELWTSDGTSEGTKLVKDIYRGTRDSCVEQMTVINGTLFFTATDGIHGAELWKSDGTPEGTVMVKDIVPGPKYGQLIEFTDVDGTLYFQAGDETNGFELWKSDGTEAGTILIKDINEGRSSSSPENLTNIDGVLYFSADDGVHGRELWKSDGTGDGTILVQDIVPGEATSEPADITNGNGIIYFSADDGIHGRELWQSDGTTDGTIIVADIYVGEASALPRNRYTTGDRLYTAGDRLYFSATDFEHGKELWAIPLDPDTDGDGEVYGSDNCPAIANAEQIDTDDDGVGDACDSDDDGDGTADVFDAFALDASETIDSDDDGIGNNRDSDDDNDMVDDSTDNCPTIANPSQADRNTDGIGDACDTNGIFMPLIAANVSGP